MLSVNIIWHQLYVLIVMYSTTDNTSELAAHLTSVATDGDNICTLVKRGKFNFSTFSINAYQTIEYLLNKINSADDPTDYENQNIVLIDKLQDYHDREVGNFTVTEESSSAVNPTYVAPSMAVSSVTPASGANVFEVGNIETVAGTFTLNQGQILEPWNGNAVQDVRSGTIASSSAVSTTIFKNYYSAGGTEFTSTSQSIAATLSDGDLIATVDFSDVEIGWGKIGFTPQHIINEGPIPTDSDGTSLTSERYALQELPGTTDTMVYYGVTRIFSGNSVLEYNLLQDISSTSFIVTVDVETAPNRHIIDIADDDINYKGTPTISQMGTQGGADITSDFTTSSTSKTINGASVPYTRYTRTGTVGAEQFLVVEFPNNLTSVA